MALTLQNIKDSLGRLKKDISDIDNTLFIEWIQWCIDYIYRQAVGTDPGRFINTTTVTRTTGVTTTALPTGFNGMEHYDCGLYLVNDDGTVSNYRLARTCYGSTMDGYFLEGSNINWTPTPTETDTFKLRYIAERPTFTALTEYLTVDKLSTGAEIVPSDFREYMVRAVDVLYGQWDEDPNAEALSDQRYQRVLDDLINELRREPTPFFLPDSSQMY